MGILNANRDPSWQGRKRHYLTTFSLKNLLLITFAILVVVEFSLYKRWRKNDDYNKEQPGPHHFWIRIGNFLLPDAFLTLVTGICIAKSCWHPIAALTTSILWFGLWTSGTCANMITVYSNEIAFDNVEMWYNICYLEAAFQGIFAIMYLVMMGFAALAVHEWRMKRKVGSIESVDAQTKVDLGSV